MAAVGEGFVGTASLANDATVNIQPASGHEVRLHYVTHVGAGELYITDGTNTTLLQSTASGNVWHGGAYTITNGFYAIYKNKSGNTQTVCWSAVYTKVSA